MVTLVVRDLLRRRVLVTRESAHALLAALEHALHDDDPAEVTLDFTGVEAMTPSFVDETLAVAQEADRSAGSRLRRLTFLNPPTRLSEKFAAIARARDVIIEAEDEHTWAITPLPVG